MKHLFLFCAGLFFFQVYAQDLNLNFEITTQGQANGWGQFGKGTYELGLDSSTVHSGKYSASIAYKEDNPEFYAWGYTIPAIYAGEKIKLTGYLKTENVSHGFAGLWMRIDPSVGFDNMAKRNITGTTDWTKYEIELDLKSAQAKSIVVGGILSGKGKIWIDDLHVTIDGKELHEVPLRETTILEKDTAFVNGSEIEHIAQDAQTTENLKVLGLVWGFAKYYHPEVAAGKYHWDFELFRIMPSILAAQNSEERDERLTSWLDSFGPLETTKRKDKKPKNLKFGPDLDWISNSGLSPALQAKLQDIRYAKRTGSNFYVKLTPGIGNPDFSTEDPYIHLRSPDVGYRMLALFRYWNMVQYFFPYKDLIEEDWKDVLSEFIPKTAGAETATDYQLTMLELIARIHDTHANFWDYTLYTYWGTRNTALKVNFVEGQVVVVDHYDADKAEQTGLQIGDLITHINGKTIAEHVKELRPYTPVSNDATLMRDVAKKLLRTNDSSLQVRYMHKGKTLETELLTYDQTEMPTYQPDQDSCFQMLENNIAYLYLGTIQNEYLPALKEKIQNSDGLIIDLRCYPSAFTVFTLGELLMPKKTDFVRFTQGSIETPGTFTFTHPLGVGEKNKTHYQGKVAILVNETSQSQAEYTTMAFRAAPHAQVFGSTTAAADGNISLFFLPGNLRTAFSGIGVYYPDKTKTQRIGIVPDVNVQPTIEGVRAGRDEVLEKALEWIKTGP